MNTSTKKILLSPEAIKIYKIISKEKSLTIKDLETKSNFNRGKLEFILPELKEKDLIKVERKTEELPTLTKEGEDAAKNQLIERRILYIIKKKKQLSFKELEKLGDFDKKAMNAGVGLLKKSGIIDIKKGKIILKKEEEIHEKYQEILEKIFAEKKVEISNQIKELEKRNLISIKEKKSTIITIQKKYSEMTSIIEERKATSRLSPKDIRSGSWKDIELKPYNITVEPPTYYIGRKQPYARFLDEVKQKLVGLGFQEMRGPIVELEFWNFDALFQAQDHPAREWSDVYRVSNPKLGKLPKEEYVELVKKVHEDGHDTGSRGWRYKWEPKKSARLVLRAQGTSVSARTLAELKIPSKYFSISRCYRPDTVDATHNTEFNQVEGIVADETITFRDLLGILKTFALDIAEAEECTFKPDYYPFTEPSVELSVVDPKLGRIEFGGAGIFRPEVTRPFNIDVPVIAWGLGIDRLFMVKYGITDIRELFSHKLEWLRSAKMV